MKKTQLLLLTILSAVSTSCLGSSVKDPYPKYPAPGEIVSFPGMVPPESIDVRPAAAASTATPLARQSLSSNVVSAPREVLTAPSETSSLARQSLSSNVVSTPREVLTAPSATSSGVANIKTEAAAASTKKPGRITEEMVEAIVANRVPREVTEESYWPRINRRLDNLAVEYKSLPQLLNKLSDDYASIEHKIYNRADYNDQLPQLKQELAAKEMQYEIVLALRLAVQELKK